MIRKYAVTVAVILGTFALWPAPASLADERSDMESQLQAIAAELAQLQSQLEANRGALSAERKALEAVDLDIQKNARSLSAAEEAVRSQQVEVDRVETEQAAFLAQLADREDALSAQVLAAWRLGRQSRLKLVLNQDDPARLGRLLAYYDYLGNAQAEQIRELREVLIQLDDLRASVDRELAALGEVQAQYAQQRDRLDARRSERLALLTSVENDLADDAARIAQLQQNRADLEALLERLDDALADIPADLGNRRHPAEQRGELPMPASGRVLQAFGQPREAGLSWQGWLIAARPGDPVQAVAYGRVAYADWLRGYGLLLIIDHGDGFMTLYGQNESLNAEVGDWVEPGTVISTVGQGTPRGQGLYFELRRKGKAVDPAAWVKR